MTAGNGKVEMRWLPGLASSCPGAVDLTTVGPLGRIDRAVTLPEALTLGVVIDVLCPGPSRVHELVSQLAPEPVCTQWGR